MWLSAPRWCVYMKMRRRLLVRLPVILESDDRRSVDASLQSETGGIDREPFAQRVQAAAERDIKISDVIVLHRQWYMESFTRSVERSDDPSVELVLGTTSHDLRGRTKNAGQ